MISEARRAAVVARYAAELSSLVAEKAESEPSSKGSCKRRGRTRKNTVR